MCAKRAYVQIALLLFFLGRPVCAQGTELIFDVNDSGEITATGTVVRPWKTIPLDRAYGGQWVVAGDVDRDGKVEIVSAENHNAGDVHYTSAVAAQELNGTTIWR